MFWEQTIKILLEGLITAECQCSLAAAVFINTSCASLKAFVEDSRLSGGVSDHGDLGCWSIPSAGFSPFCAGSSCVGSLCLEVTPMYTDESQNQPCTHSPRLRTASDAAASRGPFAGPHICVCVC